MDPVGIAGEHHRAIAQVLEEPGRDLPVELDEVPLGGPLLRPEHLVEVGERDLVRRGRLVGDRRGKLWRRRPLALALPRRLVVAQAQEHRLPHQPLLGPLQEARLVDDLRLDQRRAWAPWAPARAPAGSRAAGARGGRGSRRAAARRTRSRPARRR
jgi:hypothetical protein